jgi:hypothetical protein
MSAGCKDMPLDKALNIVDPDSHTRANSDMPIQKQTETFLKACRVVCAAVRHAEPENKLLTLEQLKCMNHKPVWATGKRSLGTEVNGWMLVNATSSRPATLDFTGACNFDSYGKTWIAYARKPEGSERP